MQKWEYLYLVTREKEYVINGVKHKYQAHENTIVILNRLGSDGWELVTEPSLGQFTFKRPVE